MNYTENRLLLEQFYQMQEYRISMGNQIRALTEAKESTALLEVYFQRFQEIEKDIKKDMERIVKAHPMWKHYLKGVKGMGPILSCALLSTIDIHKAQHVSSVWKYCGLAPDQKRVKGKKLDYNPFLKKTCWLIGKSFVKVKGPYRDIYDTSKMFYQNKFPKEVKVEGTKIVKYTKGHLDSMARRRTVKLFLSEFWVAWRKLEGLETSVPFMHRGLNEANTQK